MGCKLVALGKVKTKGNATLEFYKDGKPQYYCLGYINKMYDEAMEECKECKKYVNNAENDFFEMKRELENGKSWIQRIYSNAGL